MANRGDAELMPELLAELSPAPCKDHPPITTGDVQRPPEGSCPAASHVERHHARLGIGHTPTTFAVGSLHWNGEALPPGGVEFVGSPDPDIARW